MSHRYFITQFGIVILPRQDPSCLDQISHRYILTSIDFNLCHTDIIHLVNPSHGQLTRLECLVDFIVCLWNSRLSPTCDLSCRSKAFWHNSQISSCRRLCREKHWMKTYILSSFYCIFGALADSFVLFRFNFVPLMLFAPLCHGQCSPRVPLLVSSFANQPPIIHPPHPPPPQLRISI